MLQQAVIAAGIAVAAQMKAGVRTIIARIAIGFVERIMDGLIVVICKPVAGHRAVSRASSIASTPPTSTTPTSVVSSRSRLLHVFPLFDKRGLGRVR